MKILEERLEEINLELNEAYRFVAFLKKDKLVPSPGLLNQIKVLEKKRNTCMDSLELWKGYIKR